MTSTNIDLKTINEQGVSIIIGARNEGKTLPLTITSLMEDMYTSGITKFEFIVQDNGSTDETSRFFEWKLVDKGGWQKYQYSPRGMVAEGILRIFFDPVLSNVGTRNKGVEKARYENIIFSDAHQIVRPGTVKAVLETLIKHEGIVHAPISWVGASSFNPDPGYQYSYKIGEKIWGTWNKIKVADTAFAIPICGHAFLAVKKKQFLEFRGYPQAQRVYGGGEPYLDTKYWMLGSTSMMEPRALVYHLSAGRDYNWHSNDLIFNMFLVSYIMGGQKWADRILMTYLNKPGINSGYLRGLYQEALEAGKVDHDWLDTNKKLSFEEVLGLDKEDLLSKMAPNEIKNLNEDWYCTRCTKRKSPEPHVMRSWDYLNDKLHGHHRSYVQEFKLTNRDGNYFIGETPIVEPEAIELAQKYL